METGHSSWCCHTRYRPCDNVLIIDFIKSDFPQVNSLCRNLKIEVLQMSLIAVPPSTTSTVPSSPSSSTSWISTKCLATNERPPLPPNPAEHFIVISSIIIPILNDIVSENNTIRNLCMYCAQDIHDIRRLLEVVPINLPGRIDLFLKGVNLDAFAVCASEAH